MEALILSLDVACMVYLCWRLYKADSKHPSGKDLGWFAYREDRDA
jgi:hypothetical protein